MNIATLTTRVLTPQYRRYTPSYFDDALMVSAPMLEEHVIDFYRYKPVIHQISGDDTLHLNDVVLAFDNLSRKQLAAVALYHPNLPAPENKSVGLGGVGTLALRLEHLADAVSVLAALIYRLTNPRPLSWLEIKTLEVRTLSQEQIRLLLQLIRTTHQIRINQRKVAHTLNQLLPSTLHKMFTTGQTDEVKEWLATSEK